MQFIIVKTCEGKAKGAGRKISRGVGGQRKKDQKIAKNDQKIALLSIYLLNMYHG